ncbi:DNA polymerase III subunit gamma/tau [Desulforudis sp. 1088]|uniref:DNA polymerase III subunit gamma/tau n=2 Tax=Candidatus Desulforudis TaxID=471826 RepID=UPI003CE5A2EE
MSYRALYRTWRPQTFEGIVGQEHVTRTLSNAVRMGRQAHAYLFCGPRGTGKTSTAKILAKAVNCRSREDGNPCNKCPSCVGINEGSAVDFLEIDAASNRGVDEIRDLREKVKFRPAASPFKVYIVDEVHMLTHEAFNALLKTLEEPPEHVVFILATTEPHKVPLTISSRCQRFDFRRIGAQDIVERLAEVARGAGIKVEPGVLELIARVADGSLRDALGLLDQVAALGDGVARLDDAHDILGTVNEDFFKRLVDQLACGDAGGAIRGLHEVEASGKDLRIFAREFTDYLRGGLLDVLDGRPGKVALAEDGMVRLLSLFAQAEQEMRFATRQILPLELAVVRFVREPLPGSAAAQAGHPAEGAGESPARQSAGPDRDLWLKVCQGLKESRPAAAAFLSKASSVRIKPGRMVIRFKDSFAMANIAKPENRKVIEELLSQFSPGRWQVQCVMDDTTGEA